MVTWRNWRTSKLRRAARLLRLELEDRPGQLYYQIEYGRTLLSLGDAEGHDVLKLATRAVHARRNGAAAPTPAGCLPPRIPAARSARLDRQPVDGRGVARAGAAVVSGKRAADVDPGAIPFPARRFRHRFRLLERLIHLGSTRTYDKSISFDPRILGDDPRLNLAVCHIRLGRIDRAETLLQALLDSPAVGAQARQNLSAMRELQQRFRQGAIQPADGHDGGKP